MSSVSFDFCDEKYVITGASSGMGRKVALDLAKCGAKVMAIGRNQDRLDDVQKLYPKNIKTYSLDVCDCKKLEEAISDFVMKYGKLDGCVHAAGINGHTPLKSFDESLAHKIMDTTFWAGVNLVRLATKVKYANRNTSIVLFSSVAASSHEKGTFAYAATKAALNGAMGSIAKEICAKGHRINTVMPGWVSDTMLTSGFSDSMDQETYKKHLLGLGKTDDISGVVLFLLSDSARWITGANIVVDGGYLS